LVIVGYSKYGLSAGAHGVADITDSHRKAALAFPINVPILQLSNRINNLPERPAWN
jgi:hypothetical protein